MMIMGSGIISTGNAIPEVNMTSRANTLTKPFVAISLKPDDPNRNPQAIAISV